jgi:[ribosomal protein S18]-alanine N-acetyltransferase
MSVTLVADRHLVPMASADLDEVEALERTAYEFPWTRGNFQDAIDHAYPSFCLRRASGELAGYCILMRVVDELHLLNLCVAPADRQSGAALVLMREMQALAAHEGLASILLEVRPSNLRAIDIYARFGFRSIGRRKHYYPAREGREDAIVMRLELASTEGGHGLD